MIRGKLFLFLAVCAVLVPSGSGSAQTFEHMALALSSDTAPGTGGGTYSMGGFILARSTNASGDVAFWADVTDGTTTSGVFIASATTQKAVALAGDTAPGTGGGTYVSFGIPWMNASGDVAFPADVTGGTADKGIFVVASGGTQRAAAVVGDAAPGTGGGTYSSFENYGRISMNASGDVAFYAGVTGGTGGQGIFRVTSGGVHSAVAVTGGTAPGTGGDTYFGFSSTDQVLIDDSGEVAFIASVNGGYYGLFVPSGGTHSVVVRSGETAPGTGGGVYLYLFSDFSVNPSGDVAFGAHVSGGSAMYGIWVASGGTTTPVAVAGDTAPGTGGGIYTGLSTPAMNDSGDVVFRASVSGGSALNGVFLTSDGRTTAVALAGQEAPDTAGGTYAMLGCSWINAGGDVAFFSGMQGGLALQGVFKAVALPPSVPVLGVGGLMALLVVLGSGGALAASRRRRA